LNADLHLAVLINLWAVARAFDEFKPPDQWDGEVTQLLEVCPHPLLHAAAWHFIAGRSHSDLSKAATAWVQSITFARAASASPPLGADFGVLADHDFRLGYSLWGYADRLMEFGQFAQALPLLKESQAIFQARGSRYELINCLGTLGRMALVQGDVAQAHPLLDVAVALATEFNYHEMLGHLQAFLGLATLYWGDIAEARRILRENHIFSTELKDKGLLARNTIYLAETYLTGGLVDEAEQWLGQSYAYFSSPRRIRIDQVERLLVAARLAAAKQQYRRAATLFGLAEQISSHLAYRVAGPRRLAVDKALAMVREALDPNGFAEAFTTGQQMSLDEAYATILAPPDGAGNMSHNASFMAQPPAP
jgi:tetratricopeptide (TPR) repeat protein